MDEVKKSVDWERIEIDYRAGQLSLREIGSQHGVSEGAVRKRAKRDEWTRDLEAKVRAKADDLVRKQAVRNSVRAASSVTEKVVIEANAQVIAQVRSQHRVDIERARRLCMSLLAELEAISGNIPELEQLGDVLRKEDEKGADRLNDLYRAVIGLPERTKTMKALADSLKILIALEREAYGLETAGAPTAQNAADLLKEIVAHLPD